MRLAFHESLRTVGDVGEARGSESIAQSTAAGAGWSVALSVGSRAVTLVGSLAITYYLEPSVVGQVTDAAIAVASAHELALATTPLFLVANEKRDRVDAWHVTVLHVAIGALPIAAVIPLAPFLASWLRAELLPVFVPYFALTVLLDRVRMVPERVLLRDLRFRVVAFAKGLGDVFYTIVSLGLAMRGIGALSIVWGNVVRAAVWFAIVTFVADRRDWLSPAPFERARAKRILSFAWPLAIASACNFASRAWDQEIVSSVRGDVAAGLYQRAHGLAEVPSVHVGEQIGDVLFPAFSRMLPDERKAALSRSLGLLALVVFPLSIGLGLTATTLVDTALPPAWQGVGPLLAAMSILTIGRPLGVTLNAYLQASNRSRSVMLLGVLKVVVLLVAASVLTRLHPLGACVAVGLEFGVHAFVSMLVIASQDRIPLMSMLRSCGAPLLASAAMAPAIFGVRALVIALAIHRRGAGFLLELLAGAIAYVVAALIVAKAPSRDLLGLLRRKTAKP